MSEEAHTTPATASPIQELLASRTLQRASTLRTLLIYLWEHQGQVLNEYEIATAALGKNADFDPKIDATVRVHMARLRQKLRDYYESEGANSTVRVDVPAGAYRIDVQFVTSEAPQPSPAPATSLPHPEPQRPIPVKQYATIAACLLLGALCVWLWLDNRALQSRVESSIAPPVPWFWKPFLENRRGIQLIYPAPLFLEFPKERLRVRDVDVDDFAKIGESPRLTRLIDLFGPPRLNQRYTVNTDAAAAVKLAKFLARYGVDLKVYSTSSYAQEANTTDHVILLGIPATNPKLSAYIPSTGFQFSSGFSGIRDAGPNPDPKLSVMIRRQSDSRVAEPGLLASLPGQNPQTSVLILAGPNSSALASLLITPTSLDELHAVWSTQNRPKHFSVLIDSLSEGETILKTQIIRLREASVSR